MFDFLFLNRGIPVQNVFMYIKQKKKKKKKKKTWYRALLRYCYSVFSGEIDRSNSGICYILPKMFKFTYFILFVVEILFPCSYFEPV